MEIFYCSFAGDFESENASTRSLLLQYHHVLRITIYSSAQVQFRYLAVYTKHKIGYVGVPYEMKGDLDTNITTFKIIFDKTSCQSHLILLNMMTSSLLICTWINGSANNWDAGDLRCHRDHYDVTVMINAQMPSKLHQNSILYVPFMFHST